MATGLTYTTYQNAVVTQIPTLVSDPNFQTMLPLSIDYAELRIYRDLDFLQLHGTVALGNAVIGTALVSVPDTVIVLESLFYGPNSIPVTPASQEYIRTIYAGAANGPPSEFAIIGAAAGSDWVPATQLLLGPAPDNTYALNGYGTQRETTLSQAYPATYISTFLPDLFFAAAMVWWSGFAKNFGAQADDPRMAMSWEQQYQLLLKGAGVEEARDKFQSQAWAAQAPAPVATPSRE